MSAFGYTRYGQKFGVAVRDAGTRISDKLMEATDRLAVGLFELGSCTGLETNYQFLYPFVGGTQVAHSFNLADPGKKRILFEDDTTVTHNQFGVTGPGNVELFGFDSSTTVTVPAPPGSPPGSPSVIQPGPPTVADCCCAYGIYCRTAAGADQIDLMAQQTAPPVVHGIVCRRATYGDMVFWNGVNNSTGYLTATVANAQGFYGSMRPNAVNHHVYKNGVLVTYQGTGGAANSTVFRLFGGNSHNLAYCYLSAKYDGVAGFSGIPWSGAMQATMYAIVQKFQTACGRQV